MLLPVKSRSRLGSEILPESIALPFSDAVRFGSSPFKLGAFTSNLKSEFLSNVPLAVSLFSP